MPGPLSWFRWLKDDRGSIAVTTALVMTSVCSFAALSLDSGMAYQHKRRQQSATDFVALAAAGNLGAAAANAGAAAASNGFAGSDIASIELGTYLPDTTVSPAQRFTPGGSGSPNAVRVTMQKTHHYLFGALMGVLANGSPTSDPQVTTRSVATGRSVASFSIGSGLAGLNNGVANAVMSELIGSTVSLSVNDYQALLSDNVNVFAFSNAVAARLGLSAVSYDTLASVQVPLNTAVAALAGASPSAASAPLAMILAALGPSSSKITLGALINYGPYGSTTVGLLPPTPAALSVQSLLSALLEAANGSSHNAMAMNIAVPGLASVSLTVEVGEQPVGSSRIAVGARGIRASTAQTRLRLLVQLVGAPPLSALTVPITLNIAAGTAVLDSVQCTAAGSQPAVRLLVTPGVADGWIGSVSDADLQDLAIPLHPPSATLVNVAGLMKITGLAHASVQNITPTPVSFTSSDVAGAAGKSVSTADYLAPLMSTLLGNLRLNIYALGLPLDTSALNTSVGQTLATAVLPIDGVLASALQTLGVSIGNATVWVTGTQCGQAVLVN